ncbi:cilia- and flagella-associated protein 299 [Marchantia polymorpha subsp. ruderalis]|uniref:Cilia- and flagella-associated protein 299 n=2 Tax=Marchantia polymorpha TaxID=3197 RepID=A0AAF6AYD1_MARPO|nr:hypothetical protein MARPO_0006s0221 [Marchantia polymorpha]BBN04765.1 hypothetical protein Mp_3g07460 [Marchantia polymorpha subsp. ruderalis]|eukprot:PTQ48211.1 hypothetical protein MARPO_0006s0221 [Marchantia polymorpha]
MPKAGPPPRKKDRKKQEPLGPTFTAVTGNAIIQEFDTYEDYLDSQITLTDMFYLEDLELARQLIELGYRSNAEVMTRTDFADFKAAAEQARLQALRRTPKKLFSAGKDLEGYPFLKALAEREASMASSKLVLAVSSFDCPCQICPGQKLKVTNCSVHLQILLKGHEISGYIDFGERLKSEDLEPVFDRKKKLLPSPHDLSYYNWDTKIAIQNSSQNWQVIADNDVGVLLKNKKDRKTLNVDPAAPAGDLSTRTVINTKEYKHVVIFDHITRRQY